MGCLTPLPNQTRILYLKRYALAMLTPSSPSLKDFKASLLVPLPTCRHLLVTLLELVVSQEHLKFASHLTLEITAIITPFGLAT